MIGGSLAPLNTPADLLGKIDTRNSRNGVIWFGKNHVLRHRIGEETEPQRCQSLTSSTRFSTPSYLLILAWNQYSFFPQPSSSKSPEGSRLEHSATRLTQFSIPVTCCLLLKRVPIFLKQAVGLSTQDSDKLSPSTSEMLNLGATGLGAGSWAKQSRVMAVTCDSGIYLHPGTALMRATRRVLHRDTWIPQGHLKCSVHSQLLVYLGRLIFLSL